MHCIKDKGKAAIPRTVIHLKFLHKSARRDDHCILHSCLQTGDTQASFSTEWLVKIACCKTFHSYIYAVEKKGKTGMEFSNFFLHLIVKYSPWATFHSNFSLFPCFSHDFRKRKMYMLRSTSAAVHLSTVGNTVSRYSSKRQYILTSTVVGLASFSRTGTNGRKHGLMGAECASVQFPRKMTQLPVKLGSGSTNNYSSAAQIPSHEQVSVPSRHSL